MYLREQSRWLDKKESAFFSQERTEKVALLERGEAFVRWTSLSAGREKYSGSPADERSPASRRWTHVIALYAAGRLKYE